MKRALLIAGLLVCGYFAVADDPPPIEMRVRKEGWFMTVWVSNAPACLIIESSGDLRQWEPQAFLKCTGCETNVVPVWQFTLPMNQYMRFWRAKGCGF